MYKNILLVTDLEDDTDIIAERVRWLLDHNPTSKLSVLHVVEETVIGFGYEAVVSSVISGEDLDTERVKEAQTKLSQILSRNNLQAHDTNVSVAITGRKGIVDFCQQNVVDLVVIGRHRRTGLAAWFVGSTADSIMSDLSADLLIVQLGAQA